MTAKDEHFVLIHHPKKQFKEAVGILSRQIDDLTHSDMIEFTHSCSMGIDKLAALLKKHDGPKEKIAALGTLSPGQTMISVDMICKMVKVVKSQPGAEQHYKKPPHPSHHVAHACLGYL